MFCPKWEAQCHILFKKAPSPTLQNPPAIPYHPLPSTTHINLPLPSPTFPYLILRSHTFSFIPLHSPIFYCIPLPSRPFANRSLHSPTFPYVSPTFPNLSIPSSTFPRVGQTKFIFELEPSDSQILIHYVQKPIDQNYSPVALKLSSRHFCPHSQRTGSASGCVGRADVSWGLEISKNCFR